MDDFKELAGRDATDRVGRPRPDPDDRRGGNSRPAPSLRGRPSRRRRAPGVRSVLLATAVLAGCGPSAPPVLPEISWIPETIARDGSSGVDRTL